MINDDIVSKIEYLREVLNEAINNGVRRIGTAKVVRLRVRKGKVIRGKKIAAKKGFKVKGGKIVKMSSQELRNRQLATRKARIKIRAKLGQSSIKKRMTLNRRRSLGG